MPERLPCRNASHPASFGVVETCILSWPSSRKSCTILQVNRACFIRILGFLQGTNWILQLNLAGAFFDDLASFRSYQGLVVATHGWLFALDSFDFGDKITLKRCSCTPIVAVHVLVLASKMMNKIKTKFQERMVGRIKTVGQKLRSIYRFESRVVPVPLALNDSAWNTSRNMLTGGVHTFFTATARRGTLTH